MRRWSTHAFAVESCSTIWDFLRFDAAWRINIETSQIEIIVTGCVFRIFTNGSGCETSTGVSAKFNELRRDTPYEKQLIEATCKRTHSLLTLHTAVIGLTDELMSEASQMDFLNYVPVIIRSDGLVMRESHSERR